MNIVKILTVSATALLISATAQAADVLVEPEPVDYVRVCDAYGEGYFYIPGTQTCMRLGGYLRVDIKGGDNVSSYKGRKTRDTYNWRTRAELRFQTASETDWGTLRTLVELRNQWDDGHDTLSGQAHFAYVELGGLRVGVDESIFWHWTGYLGKVLNDDIVNPGTFQRTNVLSYTFSTDNGFSAIIGVEQGTNGGSDNPGDNYYLKGNGKRVGINAGIGERYDPAARHFYSGSQIDDYTPNVLFGAKFAQGWGSIAAIGAYDARWEEWAAKIRVNLNITDRVSAWIMAGYKSNDDYYAYDEVYNENHPKRKRDYYYRMHTSQYGDWGGDWALWGGGTFKATKKASFNTQLTYDDTDIFSASINVAYELVPGFVITPELSYLNYGNDKKWADDARVTFHGDDAFQGMVRMQRNF
ncbi:porin [Bartonella tamiae]|uniref:Porin n=1 Tax=Bartonella tamiae Th239 TaxID=1094558 RepID=J1JVH6_9HYPH|nr:porin [Bartonella tamiae]EJF88947.1 hypothetical protein ME5_01498 [Bartonella tamiae Th239]EJF94803.1 hypothetical protein MEG_00384 [Bartonella tamiae Th307]